METISANYAFTRLEDMIGQLEESWPKTFQTILEKYNHGNEPFFVYSFTKWDFKGLVPEYKLYHQPRKTMPDPFWGTILRKIDPANGKSEIIWSLPHEEGQRSYGKGKIFEDEFVQSCIEKKKKGILDLWVEEYNQKKFDYDTSKDEFKKI